MKKYFLMLMALPIALVSIAQEKFPFFAKNSEEFMNPVQDKEVKNAHIDNFGRFIVKTNNGEQEYKLKDIWGYRNKHGKEFRISGGEQYQVLATGDLCIYALPTTVILTKAEGDAYPAVKYYFSNRIDGQMYQLNLENIKTVFSGTNQKFVDLMNKWKWDNEYIKFDRQHHSYKIEEVYNEVRKGSAS